MLGWSKKKNAARPITILAPITGRVVPLAQVPDEAFAGKYMGEGIAIEPTEGVLTAPFDGTVAHLIDTHHAVIVEHASGLQLLLHIGINTVGLKGTGFRAKVAIGDSFTAGQPLIEFDLEAVKAAGYPVVTPVVIANQETVESFEIPGSGDVAGGQSILISVTMKS